MFDKTNKPSKAPSFDLNKNVIFSLKRPFLSYETDSIRFYEDSVLVPFVFKRTTILLRILFHIS